MSLTPKQNKILEFILSFTKENGYNPSQQEIAKHFGFKSLGTVQDYLSRLQTKGYIEKKWNSKRDIKVFTEQSNILNLPKVGKVAAGLPIEAIENEEFMEIPSSLIKKGGDHFILEVSGDSMIEEGIFSGDFVIIKKQNMAENGQTVVALINNEATIKTYYQFNDRIELRPANSKYKTIIVKNNSQFQIEGVMMGLMRLNTF